jgi:hypothetical protein
MLKTINDDLENAAKIMEHIMKMMPQLSREEKIDLAARVCAIRKNAVSIEQEVKDDIHTWRKGHMGYILGDVFKAFLNKFPVTRLDQVKLKTAYPKVYAACLKSTAETRITFETR